MSVISNIEVFWFSKRFAMQFTAFIAVVCAWVASDVSARATIGIEDVKVVGGQQAVTGQLPYQASIQDVLGIHFCGAVIISPDYVITTASCIQGRLNIFDWVIGGFVDLNNEGTGQNRLISDMTYHADYSGEPGSPNDIAYLRVNRPFEFDDKVQPAKLPTPGLTPSLEPGNCTVSGWGATDSSGTPPFPNMLQYANIQALSDEDCSALLEAVEDAAEYGQFIPETNICAYTPEGGVNACNFGHILGDTGGPLVCTANEDGERYLFGILAWGPPTCGQKGFPAVCTDVIGYLDWIESSTGVTP